MKILLTGFEPFGGEKVNPAYEAVIRLPEEIAGARIVKLELPTVFRRSAQQLEQAVREERPDVVLCVGQAGGRADISVEKVAINLMDARIADNAGYRPSDEPIREGGETAYFSTVPVKSMVEAVRACGIPAHVSYSAGTYVCNFILYELLAMASERYPQMWGGFIHVPYEPAQTVGKAAETPSMPVETIADGLKAAVEVTARAWKA